MKFELPTDGLDAFKTKSEETYTAVKDSLKTNNDLMYTTMLDWYTKNDGVVDAGEKNHLDSIIKYGIDEQNSIKSKQKTITEIIQRAIDEKRALNEQEIADIQAHQLAMRNMAMTQLSETGAQELAIRQRITGQITSMKDTAFKKWVELQKASQQERLSSQDIYYGTLMDAENKSHAQALLSLQVGSAEYNAEVTRHQTAVTDITTKSTTDRMQVISDDAVKTVEVVTGANAKQILEYNNLKSKRVLAYELGDGAQAIMLENLMAATGVTAEQSGKMALAYSAMSEEEKLAWDKMVRDTDMSVTDQINAISDLETKAPASVDNAMTNMKQGIINGTPSLVDEMKMSMESAETAANNTGDFASIGGNLVGGIASGIINSAWMITNAMKNAVMNAVAAGEEAGQIHSPSRLTESNIGKPLAQGSAVGIERNAYLVEDEMSKMVSPDKLIPNTIRRTFSEGFDVGGLHRVSNVNNSTKNIGGINVTINTTGDAGNIKQELINAFNELGVLT
jgi:hypothetical protein